MSKFVRWRVLLRYACLTMIIGVFALMLHGCGGVNTKKPVYEGLLSDGVVLKQSQRKIEELRTAKSVAVVLSQSTRETLDGFREGVKEGMSYPVDSWVLQLVRPVKAANANAGVAPNLNARSMESWVVVIHWAALFQPFVIGGTVEYHVLDPNLGQVAVFRADETGNCDSLSSNSRAVQEHYVKCYDQFLTGLIDKAGAPLLALAK